MKVSLSIAELISVRTVADRIPESYRVCGKGEEVGAWTQAVGSGDTACLLRLYGKRCGDGADQGATEWDREVLATLLPFVDMHSIHN